MDDPTLDARRPPDLNRLRASLEAAGWKWTRQRAAVYERLQSFDGHPTADEVYRAVKAVVPSISLATVYKALEALVDSGLAARLASQDGPARYDGREERHHHLRCLRSGSVQDVPTDYDPDLIAKIDPHLASKLRDRGFRVTGYRLELLGYFDEPGRDFEGPATS